MCTRYDELLKAHFEDEAHYAKTLTLWDFVCPVCRDPSKSKFNGLFALQKHIKTAHQLYYCDVCLKYRKVGHPLHPSCAALTRVT